ncbi:MAG: hypothetical protein D9V44_10925 [Actinobacteria bacterium]|nr:MAG: hypothetical protein D9V44_10925 [Actinomycetota bacterium]
MVARSDTTIASRPGAIAGWFQAWRKMLTITARTLRRLPGWIAAGIRRCAISTREAARNRLSAALASSRRRARAVVTGTVRNAEEVTDSVGWIFDGWRRFLARTGRVLAVRTRLTRMQSASRYVVTYLRRPAALGDLDVTAIDSVAAFGVRTLIIGSFAGIVVGWLTMGAFGIAVSRAAGTLAWAAARLAILLALSPRGRENHLRAYAAWACSLVPFIFGVTEGLRLLALAASAWLCLEGLLALDVHKRTARSMVLWSFGGQASVIALGWLLRGGIAAIAALL